MALPTDGIVKKLVHSLVFYPDTVKLVILAIIMTLVGIIDVCWRNGFFSFEDGKLVHHPELIQAWGKENAAGRN